MRIVSWNIRWGKGMDGRVDLRRTIAALKALGEADILCLQEVTQGFPALAGPRADQLAELARAFPRHEAVFGAAVDVPGEKGGRSRFGNLLLSSRRLLQLRQHALPFPADAAAAGVARACVEVVVSARHGPVRVLTTHLEYRSRLQRRAQLEYLRELQLEAAARASLPLAKEQGDKGNPAFRSLPSPVAAVLCGDFNLQPESPEYALLGSAAGLPAGAQWQDAWCLANAEQPHAPTVGVHGPGRANGAVCRDYFWVAGCLAQRVRAVKVDTGPSASDHQPVVLELED